MKFIITRASHWGDDQPCEEATPETYTVTQQRLVRYVTKGWLNEGHDHHEEGDMSLRSAEMVRWVVDINSLEQLMEFQKKYGRIIIQYDNELKIYDDYIE
jgi:hypothetical protein